MDIDGKPGHEWATPVYTVCSMSTKGTTKDEKLVNLWFGMSSNPDSPEDGSTIWKSSSPSLSILDGGCMSL